MLSPFRTDTFISEIDFWVSFRFEAKLALLLFLDWLVISYCFKLVTDLLFIWLECSLMQQPNAKTVLLAFFFELGVCWLQRNEVSLERDWDLRASFLSLGDTPLNKPIDLLRWQNFVTWFCTFWFIVADSYYCGAGEQELNLLATFWQLLYIILNCYYCLIGDVLNAIGLF